MGPHRGLLVISKRDKWPDPVISWSVQESVPTPHCSPVYFYITRRHVLISEEHSLSQVLPGPGVIIIEDQKYPIKDLCSLNKSYSSHRLEERKAVSTIKVSILSAAEKKPLDQTSPTLGK